MSERYLAPIPKSAPTRVADRLLDQYLQTPIGSSAAATLVSAAYSAHRSGDWEYIKDEIEPKKARRKGKGVSDLTCSERQLILEMYDGEYTLDQIAQAVGGSVGTVNRFLDAEQVPRRNNRINRMKIEAMLRQGFMWKMIASQEKCSMSTVTRIAKGMKS